MNCKFCQGECKKQENGKYKCLYCGSVFSEDDVMTESVHVKEKSISGGASVFEKNIGGILEITWQNGNILNSGSGFLINKQGYAITNTHVVTFADGKSCEQVWVKINNTKVPAVVVALGDDRHGDGSGVDLALIKLQYLPRGAVALEFEDFEKVRIGEQVYVVGNSLGAGTCITSGIVSDKSRIVKGKRLLMTDCAINGGNSGGPMFNEKGKVIGAIVSGVTGAEGMNFAVPCDIIIQFLSSVRKTIPMF